MATNFLDSAGSNGFIQAPFNLQSTELNALASGSAITSSVGGSSGIFNQASWANAIWGSIYFVAGGAFTPAAGGYLAGWFLLSPDGGTTFETIVATPGSTVLALARAPDFIVPVYQGGAAYAANNFSWQQGRFCKVPWETHKIVIQNMSGAALPSTGNLIKAGGVAIQY
jgi:hypothetical protein